jgi:hypothetical protein
VRLSGVPVVPESVIVEAFAASVPVEPIARVVPESERLVPSEVFNVPFTVIVPSDAEFAFIVIVTPALIVILSFAPGTPPAPEHPDQFAPVFQLPVVVAEQVAALT